MFAKRLRTWLATPWGWWVLMMIVALAIRSPYWSHIPLGLNRDEAALGYNAYAIAQTGRDEYGKFLPASFTSFGDQKLPGYIYTLVPIISAFGLSAETTKLPSLLAGLGIIALGGLFARRLVADKHRTLAFRLTTFFLAVSPWANHFSRVAYEAHLAMFFYLGGLVTVMLAFSSGTKQRQRWLLITSALGFALAVATYHSYHILVPITLLGLALTYRKQIFSADRPGIIAGGALGFIIALWLFVGGVWSANQTKIAGISPYRNEVLASQIQTWHESVALPNSIKWLLWNRPVAAFATFSTNLALVFSPTSFFVPNNAHGVHNPYNVSNLHLLAFPLCLLGLWWLAQTPFSRPKATYLIWLLGASLAPALTIAPQHTIRLSPMFPALEILSALGVLALFTIVPKRFKFVSLWGVVALFLLSTVWTTAQYWWVAPYVTRTESHEPFELLARALRANEAKYDHVITTSPSDSPYIWYLFQTRFDPRRLSPSVKRYAPDKEGFQHVSQVNKLEFHATLDWPALETSAAAQRTLLIVKPREIPIDKQNSPWPHKIGEVTGSRGDLYYELWEL